MTEYSPFKGRHREPEAPMVLIRTLWTMRSSVGKEITAAIYDVMTGRELRVSLGAELLESRLTRTDDDALESRARELCALLETRGWQVAG